MVELERGRVIVDAATGAWQPRRADDGPSLWATVLAVHRRGDLAVVEVEVEAEAPSGRLSTVVTAEVARALAPGDRVRVTHALLPSVLPAAMAGTSTAAALPLPKQAQ